MDKIVLSGFADEISSSLDRQIQVLKKLGIFHMEIWGVEKKGIDTYTTEEVKRSRVSWMIRGSPFLLWHHP